MGSARFSLFITMNYLYFGLFIGCSTTCTFHLDIRSYVMNFTCPSSNFTQDYSCQSTAQQPRFSFASSPKKVQPFDSPIYFIISYRHHFPLLANFELASHFPIKVYLRARSICFSNVGQPMSSY